ncbi:MAG: FecR family protein [Candidatus Riflebacteria bacterium]|nr:FecR family protein [Candidatus Riflebacteria bacterium]
MSCQKAREWLENSSAAGLSKLPADLRQHLVECPACATLISKISYQCVTRLPENLVAGIPAMKKQIWAEISKQRVQQAEKTGIFAWPPLWKLAFIPLILLLSLIVVYVKSNTTTRVDDHKAGLTSAVATVVRISNQVERQCAGSIDFLEVKAADLLVPGDAIKTGKNSSVELIFADGSKIAFGSEAYFQVKGEKCLGDHRLGRAVFEIKKQTPAVSVEVSTPQGITAVLGTVFVQELGKEKCFIAVAEGVVEFRPNNNAGKHLLRKGDLLRFDSSGKIIDRKELDSAALLKLSDLAGLVPVETVSGLNSVGQDASSTIIPEAVPSEIPDASESSTEEIDKIIDEGELSSDSVQIVPIIGTEELTNEEDVPNKDPYQPEGTGQSSLGVSGF